MPLNSKLKANDKTLTSKIVLTMTFFAVFTFLPLQSFGNVCREYFKMTDGHIPPAPAMSEEMSWRYEDFVGNKTITSSAKFLLHKNFISIVEVEEIRTDPFRTVESQRVPILNLLRNIQWHALDFSEQQLEALRDDLLDSDPEISVFDIIYDNYLLNLSKQQIPILKKLNPNFLETETEPLGSYAFPFSSKQFNKSDVYPRIDEYRALPPSLLGNYLGVEQRIRFILSMDVRWSSLSENDRRQLHLRLSSNRRSQQSAHSIAEAFYNSRR